jgi:tetratricopeptide (TPR) repeat protein
MEPENAEFLYNLGTSQRFMGDFEKAEENYEKVIAINPAHYDTHFSLSEFNNITAAHNHIERLEKLLSENTDNSLLSLFVSYALYKEYDSLGEFDKAFKILKQVNNKRSAELAYPPIQDKRIFDCLERCFSNVKTDVNEGYQNNEAIFVLGMPRSGTTLVDRIISSHSEVMSAGELQSFGVLLKQASLSQTDKVLDEATIEAGLKVDFAALGKAYIDSTRPITGKKAHFIDKMPINFYYLGFILKALPKAKIICLDRNPMDTCIGNFRQLFAPELPYYQYSYDLKQTGEYYLQFKHLMEFWKQQYKDRFLTVKYEALVQQPEKNVREILSFCDLDWQESCLQFHKNKAPVSTASSVQVRQPINTKFIGRWKKYQSQVTELTELFDKAGLDYE